MAPIPLFSGFTVVMVPTWEPQQLITNVAFQVISVTIDKLLLGFSFETSLSNLSKKSALRRGRTCGAFQNNHDHHVDTLTFLLLTRGFRRGASLGFRQNGLTGTELESQDRSARPRIETSHVDLQDVRSAKLQACMKSANNQHTWHASSSEQNDSNDPAQS